MKELRSLRGAFHLDSDIVYMFDTKDIRLCILDDAEKIYSTEIFQKQIIKPLNSGTSCRFVMLNGHPFKPPMLREWKYIENLESPNIQQYFLYLNNIADKLEAIISIYKVLKEANVKGIVFCQVSNLLKKYIVK